MLSHDSPSVGSPFLLDLLLFLMNRDPGTKLERNEQRGKNGRRKQKRL